MHYHLIKKLCHKETGHNCAIMLFELKMCSYYKIYINIKIFIFIFIFICTSVIALQNKIWEGKRDSKAKVGLGFFCFFIILYKSSEQTKVGF